MSDDSYFIFNLIDNSEEVMQNCDKISNDEKVKMFDEINKILLNTKHLDAENLETDERGLILTLLGFDYRTRQICKQSMNSQFFVSGMLERFFSDEKEIIRESYDRILGEVALLITNMKIDLLILQNMEANINERMK